MYIYESIKIYLDIHFNIHLDFLFIQGKCTGDKIMLACRPVGASDLRVLAWADRATVFGVTDEEACNEHCSGNVVEVIFHKCSIVCSLS